ncbi:YvrJ family protein [Lacticaseibacillus hegangensis]|nr:YvrJ family protein [Lacticaseibacillus hegangensis]
MDQAAGVIIAVILIFRVEARLDQLVKSFEDFTRQMLIAVEKMNSEKK